MLRKKSLAATLALSIGIGGAFASAPIAASAAGDVQVSSEFNISADVSVQQEQLANFVEIKSYFSAELSDAEKIEKAKAFYEENFKADVQARLADIDSNISTVLEAGVSGKATAGQVKQAVDKGLQWYFYEEIKNLIKAEAGGALKEGNKQLAKENLDKAIALFEGSVYVTAGKRDENFETLTQNFFQIVVPELYSKIEEGDHAEFEIYRQYFEKTMMKVFVQATIRYAEKVPQDHASGNIEKEKAHLAEGYFFFMPIHKYLSSGSQEAADAVKNAFASGNGANVDAEEIKTNLAIAITAKANGYFDKSINTDLASGNIDKALYHAAEGNTFASQLEVIIKERLGADAYTELQSHGQKYYAALKASNASEAQAHSFAISHLLGKLTGVSFKVGAKSLLNAGQEVTLNEAASYIDASTNRTLASARFVSEALGAKVDWNGAEQKAVITKGGKTVEFTIGSKDVYVNGEKSNYTLDQAALINNERTYIPVRAAAELLDGKVLYIDGEVVINY
jgi:predicted enzyme related to lactoylglutathione lyase